MLTHSQNFNILYSDIDFSLTLKPSAIMQYLQELAANHAYILGNGFSDMQQNGLFFVLNRLSFVVNEYPKVGTKIKIVTHPKQPKIVDVARDFYIYDANTNNCLIKATSKWCVLDTKNFMVRRVSPAFAKFTADQYITTNAIENGNPQLEPLVNAQQVYSGTVTITDLDQNNHLNNIKYGDIVLNACTYDKIKNSRISRFDINFLAQLKYGDNYTVYRVDTDNESFFETVYDTNKIAFRAKIKWTK